VNSFFVSLGIENWKPVLTSLILPPVPLLVLVLIKLRTCPEVTIKYSGTLAGRYVAALFAVTTAVEPIVAQIGSVLAIRT